MTDHRLLEYAERIYRVCKSDGIIPREDIIVSELTAFRNEVIEECAFFVEQEYHASARTIAERIRSLKTKGAEE